ncbi:permease-like cell division protein FtsX [Herminiimonas sp. CN]|uniref:permease-like cell division protein FtsX n=1 Tax=Herminiimonas sp. CN TaxID=1349818 RepID=UPI000473D1C5|nr:permease-like cell division protein FtsX [Herminiimonas sp. CN]
MKIWLREHRFALTDALRKLIKTPGSFSFNVLVVAIALALPIAGLTLLENIRPITQQLAVEPEISLFLKADTPNEQARALAYDIRSVLPLASKKSRIEFIPREQALETLKAKTGLADALATLGQNPLPDAYIIRLSNIDAVAVDALAERLQLLPRVEAVQVDSAWVKRLTAMLQVMRLALLLLATTLGVVVMAVVFNTVRLQVLTQREEIAVSRLIGATDAFIHRPFYYTGALLGLCAGAVALAAVTLALQPLNDAIAEFARLYASEFRLAALAPSIMLTLLAVSAALGLLGAALSVRRHLARLP